MATKKTEVVVVSEKTGFLREILGLIDKYGFFKVIFGTFMMMFIAYATYLSFNPSIIFERYSQYESEKHSQSFEQRMTNSPVIQSDLDKMILETDAMRGFIIELHNGKYNSAGLSFNYGSLTYESVCDSVESIGEDYADFTIDRYPLTLVVYKKGYWSGTIEDLRSVDKRLALRLESNGAYYLAVQSIYGTKDNIGFIGVTYPYGAEINEENIKAKLSKYSIKVSSLLDTKKGD